MARKHAKKFKVKQPVERTVLVPEKVERKVLTNHITGMLEVKSIITPAVVKQGKAAGSTSTKGNRNVPTGGKK